MRKILSYWTKTQWAAVIALVLVYIGAFFISALAKHPEWSVLYSLAIGIGSALIATAFNVVVIFLLWLFLRDL